MNILTFDIEDWYNHDNYSRDFEWDKHEVRLYDGVDKILLALEEANDLKGTFFCLGWVAEKHPAIVRKIVDAGHHLGCHSYQHELITRFSPKEFEEDTYKSKALLEDIGGVIVDTYRAPSFSITMENTWAFEVLLKLGFKYDSSVFEAKRECGGLSMIKENKPFLIQVGENTIKEFPVSPVRFFGKEIPFSGGGYFRVMPYFLFKRIMRQEEFVTTYFHPSDFDPEQPKMPHLSFMRQFKNRVGLRGTYDKFKHFINEFEFKTVLEADEAINWGKVSVYDYQTFKKLR